ncbi:MAG: NTP transferase domain-containing protein [Propionibacteriaceae bacterium]|jgi:mannose-1-phosphate guanylyltransferase|nr:NTP transferase domain-containing protein [Propionibacteriaceae bacterium]
MRYVVIMAGGSGTRLWPLSVAGTPKQLLPILGGKSLLQKAFERATALVPAEQVLVVTSASYAEQVAAQLPGLLPENLLGEPEGRDSLNAAAWPAAVLAARDPDAVIAQITADQLIDPLKKFVKAFERAFTLAVSTDLLVTLGIVPTHAHTGFGYIRRSEKIEDVKGAYLVSKFVEKPKRKVAEEYLESGKYWWNAGLFVWKAATFLEHLREQEPEVFDGVSQIAADPSRLGEIFPTLKKTSIDYGIMEPLAGKGSKSKVAVVALNADWRDVGGYPSLGDILENDESNNSVMGQVVSVAANDNIIINDDPDTVIGVVGIEGLVVVRTGKATLVVPVDQAEKIKKLVPRVAEAVGEEFV